MKPSAFTQNDNVRLTPRDLNGRDWEGGTSEKKRRGQGKLVRVSGGRREWRGGIVTFHSNAWPGPIKSLSDSDEDLSSGINNACKMC